MWANTLLPTSKLDQLEAAETGVTLTPKSIALTRSSRLCAGTQYSSEAVVLELHRRNFLGSQTPNIHYTACRRCVWVFAFVAEYRTMRDARTGHLSGVMGLKSGSQPDTNLMISGACHSRLSECEIFPMIEGTELTFVCCSTPPELLSVTRSPSSRVTGTRLSRSGSFEQGVP